MFQGQSMMDYGHPFHWFLFLVATDISVTILQSRSRIQVLIMASYVPWFLSMGGFPIFCNGHPSINREIYTSIINYI